MPLNELIAQSGAQFYENMRTGFLERPGEARQRKLEELTITGRERGLEKAELDIEKTRGELSEWEAGASTRELKRQEEARQVSPEFIEQKKRQEAAVVEQLEISNKNTIAAMDRAETTQERTILAENKVEYNTLALEAINQADTAAGIEYIRKNKKAFLDAGTEDEDAQIEELLNASPEQQEAIMSSMKAGNRILIKQNLDLQKTIAKEAAKPAKPGTPAAITGPVMKQVRQSFDVSEDFQDLEGSYDEDTGTYSKQQGKAMSSVTNAFQTIRSNAKVGKRTDFDENVIMQALTGIVNEQTGVVNDDWGANSFMSSEFEDLAGRLSVMMSNPANASYPTRDIVDLWYGKVVLPTIQKKTTE